MHCELMFPSLFLKAADLRGRDVTLTIRELQQDSLAVVGTSKTEKRWILYFAETAKRAAADGSEEKRLVLNKTNVRTIKSLYGAETNDWTGQRITLYPTTAKFKGDDVEAIRIRPTAPQAAPTREPGEEG